MQVKQASFRSRSGCQVFLCVATLLYLSFDFRLSPRFLLLPLRSSLLLCFFFSCPGATCTQPSIQGSSLGKPSCRRAVLVYSASFMHFTFLSLWIDVHDPCRPQRQAFLAASLEGAKPRAQTQASTPPRAILIQAQVFKKTQRDWSLSFLISPFHFPKRLRSVPIHLPAEYTSGSSRKPTHLSKTQRSARSQNQRHNRAGTQTLLHRLKRKKHETIRTLCKSGKENNQSRQPTPSRHHQQQPIYIHNGCCPEAKGHVERPDSRLVG